jgi:hypothetical protein
MTPSVPHPSLRSWRALALVAGAAALPLAGQDLAYVAPKTQPVTIFQNQANVTAAIPGTYFGMIGNDWGYGGIQMTTAEQLRTAIFSIWDTDIQGVKEETTEYAFNATLDIARHGRFGGEGTGCQFLINYPWVFGRDYRVAYRVFAEPDGSHLRLSGFLYDSARKDWTYAVTYRAATGGAAFSSQALYSFQENYLATFGDRAVTMSNAWIYSPGSGWTDLTSGKAFNLPKGPDDYGQILGGSGFLYRSGKDPAIKVQAEWEPVAYTQMPSEAPIPVPFFLGCGSTSAQGNWEPDGYWKDLAGDATTLTLGAVPDLRGVLNPAPDAVYRTVRAGSSFEYTLEGFHPGETCAVRLHFVEPSCTRPGQRLENVTINGCQVLRRFDVFTAACGKGRAVVRSFEARADALGRIRIRFDGVQGKAAVVSGISAAEGRPRFDLEGPQTVQVMRGFGCDLEEAVDSLDGYSQDTSLGVLALPLGVSGRFTPGAVSFGDGGNVHASTLALSAAPWARTGDQREAVVYAFSFAGGQRFKPLRVEVVPARPVFLQAAASAYVDSASTLAATFPGTQVAGDLDLVVVQTQDITSDVASVSDAAGNAYTLMAGPVRNPDQPGSQWIYGCPGIRAAAKGSNTVTVAFVGTAAYPDILLANYSGVRTLVAQASATGSTEGLDSGPVNVTGPDQLVFSAANVAWWTNAPGAGFTQRIQSDWGNVIQDLVPAAAGTVHGTATQNGGAPWIIQTLVFK